MLMAFILVVTLFLAAWRQTGLWWNGLFLKMTVAVLLLASLTAGTGRRRARSWCFGFALFGWTTLLLNMLCMSFPDNDHKIPTHFTVLYLTQYETGEYIDYGNILINPRRFYLESHYIKNSALVSLIAGCGGATLTAYLLRKKKR
jgi:phosphatidylglycerophosphate synthase